MLRHRWKILTGIAVAFVVFICIEVATIGNGPKKEVEAYKKSLIAQGEKLDISELLPPPVSPEQNGADLVNQALGMLTTEDFEYSNLIAAARLIAPGKAIVCFEQPDVRDWNSINSWSNEMAVVEDDRPMTELLRQAANYPAIEFNLDYKDPFGPQQTRDLRHFVYSAHRLSAEVMCDLHRGDSASATTDICTILAFVNGLQEERLDGFQYIRIIMARIAGDTSWELLQSDKLNDSDLAVLQSCWKRLEFIHPMENALVMTRAYLDSEDVKMQTSDEYFDKEMSWAKPSAVDWSDGLRSGLSQLADNARVNYCKSMCHASWIYSDELQMLQNGQIVLETIRTAETNRFFYPASSNMINQPKALAASGPDDWLTKMDKYGFHHMTSVVDQRGVVVSRLMGVEAIRSIVIAAIALKRYQLKHGNYPVSLSELAPNFVASAPRDPVDGKPLRYQLMVDGSFLLYSVGLNGKDDGGDGSSKKGITNYSARWTDENALDWVWPQPATPAEIESFYAHPPGP